MKNLFDCNYSRIVIRSIKAFLLTIFFLFYSSLILRAQSNFLKEMPFYLDHDEISKFKDSLGKMRVDTFISFLTREDKNNFTYFIWIKNGNMSVVKISENMISDPQAGKQHFIQKMDINSLAIRNSESNMKFLPPVDPSQCDIAFIYIHSNSYIIEYGTNSHYQLDPARNKSRSNFMKSIKSDLALFSDNWKYNTKHNRYAD